MKRVLVVIIAALFLVEVAAQIARPVYRWIVPVPTDDRVNADVYAGKEWAEDYFRDLRSIPIRWEPYTYWRRETFDGDGISVYQGQRWTPAPKTTVKVVFCLGGSAMWGTGVRDLETIPSLLAERFPTWTFVNLAESGYVSTQELIVLILALQRGERPSVVIFYDGVNDLTAAYQGRPGQPLNESNREREFNLLQPDRWMERVRLAFGDMLDKSVIARAVRRGHHSELSPPSDPVLIARAMSLYEANLTMARALGKRYGFQVLAYWQPTVFDKLQLSPHETRQAEQSAGIEPWIRESRALYLNRIGVHDLSGIFRDDPKPRFVDAWHVGEEGNVVIADRIAEDLAE